MMRVYATREMSPYAAAGSRSHFAAADVFRRHFVADALCRCHAAVILIDVTLRHRRLPLARCVVAY